MTKLTQETEDVVGLADYLRRCCERSYGPSALVTLPASAVLKAADRIDVLEGALERLSSSFTGGWAGMYRERAEVIAEVEQIACASLRTTHREVNDAT